MNSHCLQSPISRVLVLGHSGFIGRHLIRRLHADLPDVEILGEALPSIDLTRIEDARLLVPRLDSHTALAALAAIKEKVIQKQGAFLERGGRFASIFPASKHALKIPV